jgi:hypothetical protein
MAEVVYTTVPGKIGALLSKIRSNGVPRKVDTVWLKAIGFTSSNDKSLLPVLRNIDFVDGSKTPTDRWKKFRGIDGDAALGDAIKQGYGDLYDFYDDAHDRTMAEIANVFKTKSTAGDQAISKAVSTFKALAASAKFNGSGRPANQELEPFEPAAVPRSASIAPPTAVAAQNSSAPSLHIDLQVHISPEATADQIDKIFASMAKHLYRRED